MIDEYFISFNIDMSFSFTHRLTFNQHTFQFHLLTENWDQERNEQIIFNERKKNELTRERKKIKMEKKNEKRKKREKMEWKEEVNQRIAFVI